MLVVILKLRVGGELHPTALFRTANGMSLVMHMSDVRKQSGAIGEHFPTPGDLAAMRTLPSG